MAQESWNETKQTDGPILCANNCGFFGSAMTNNLCSKCYKDLIAQQQVTVPLTNSEVKEAHATVASSSVLVSPAAEGSSKLDDALKENVTMKQVEEVSEKHPPNRCLTCRKRVSLTGFKCRCGGTFCSSHRYSEFHECSFDYKGAGREAISKGNPVVKAEKIEKI